MAIKRPDIYEHNNPNLPIVDSDFVKGGVRSAVQNLSDLYALSTKNSQLKQHSTQIYVSGVNKFYVLKDINNIGNSDGWEEINFGVISSQKFTPNLYLRTSAKDTNGNNAGGIVSAISEDGIKWTSFVRRSVFPNFARDASTIWYNNQWVSVYTNAFTSDSKTFGIATSTNLTSWTIGSPVLLTGPDTIGTANNVWAPEWFIDENNYYVLVRLSTTAGQNYGLPGMGYIKALNPGTWTSWTDWTPFDSSIRSDANDFYIVKKSNKYYLFSHGGTHLTSQVPPGLLKVNNITLQESDYPFSGYSELQEITEDLRGIIRPNNASAFFEGPSVISLGGQNWRLYFQDGLDNSLWSVDSFDDFQSWPTGSLRKNLYEGFDGGGHGTVLKIDQNNYVGILNSLLNINNPTALGAVDLSTNQTISGSKNFAIRPTVNGTGVLLQGETAAGIVENAVYTTGAQTITGPKNFTTRPTLSGLNLITTGDLVDLELEILGFENVVYTTGNQTISGVKNFVARPTVDGTGVLLSGEMTTQGIINTTYSALTGLKAANNLLSGQYYRISDFHLMWRNQSINDNSVKSGLSPEPLIVLALSRSGVSHEAKSEIYPQDTIYYDVDATSSNSWGTINNNTAIPNFKGWIYRRIDHKLNIDIPWDWRHITVNCCRPDMSSIGLYNSATTYSLYGVVKNASNKLYYSVQNNNTNNSLTNTDWWLPVSDFTEGSTYFVTDESYGFRAYNTNGTFVNLPADTSTRIQQPTFTSSLISQGIFQLTNCNNIKIEGGYSNVFLGSNIRSNTIGNFFYSNTIGINFNSNTIGNIFNVNTIGNNFNSNTIGNIFNSNTIGNDFFYNTIGNDFFYNTIGNAFFSNTIGNFFYYNTIGNFFYSNTIGNSFNFNTIGNNFIRNTIEDDNTIGNATGATHIYNNYNTRIFANSNNTVRLSYFNANDQLVVTDPTA
jgi:hypothetical protein